MRNGHVRRITDEDIGSAALEICGNNVSTTTVTCPEEDRQTLGWGCWASRQPEGLFMPFFMCFPTVVIGPDILIL